MKRLYVALLAVALVLSIVAAIVLSVLLTRSPGPGPGPPGPPGPGPIVLSPGTPGVVTNPVLDFMPDPCAVLEGDTYYLYGSRPMNGVEVFASRDLQTWTSQGMALPADPGFTPQWNSYGYWAPDVFKRQDGVWVMTYSWNGWPGVRWGWIEYALSRTGPTGPFERGGKIKGIRSTANKDDGLDFHRFLDPQTGQEYAFWVTWGGVYVGRFDSATFTVTTDETTSGFTNLVISELLAPENWAKRAGVSTDGVNEAPFCMLNPADGMYYVTYSACATGPNYSICCARASSPLGPYTKLTIDQPLVWGKRTPGCDFEGTGGASFVRSASGNLLCFMHIGSPDYDPAAKVDPRNLCITNATLDASGLRVEPPTLAPTTLRL